LTIASIPGVNVANGFLELIVQEGHVAAGWSEDHQDEKKAYDFTCGELRTNPARRIRYGRIETRMKAPSRETASGYISSLFTYVNEPDAAGNREWEEIDIELEGRRPDAFQANLIYGRNTWEWWRTRDWGAWEHVIKVGPVDEWRVLAIEWLPEEIRWYVDGKLVKTLKQEHLDCRPACRHPQKNWTPIPDNYADILVNFWIPNNIIQSTFGGKKKRNVYPMKTQYDWLRYYQYDAVPVATWQDRTGMVVDEEQPLDVQLGPVDAETRNEAIAAYNQGRDALEQRDAEAAKQKFLEAVTIDAGLAEAWLVLARLYMNDGQHAKAADAAETYLRHDPEATDAMAIAYDAYFALGDRAKAQQLREKLGRVPEQARKLAVHTYNEGAEAYGAGDYDAAIAAFRAAIELDPQLAPARSGLANSLYGKRRFDEGLAAVENWLRADPDHPDALQLKFLMLNALGRRDEAGEALNAFAEQDPKAAAELLFRRAELDFKAEDREAARPGLEQALELNPRLARAHYLLGLILYSFDKGKAKEHLQRFLDLTPDDPDAAEARLLLEAQ
jgi:tetratricopeptide (TPR) repeat protein